MEKATRADHVADFKENFTSTRVALATLHPSARAPARRRDTEFEPVIEILCTPLCCCYCKEVATCRDLLVLSS